MILLAAALGFVNAGCIVANLVMRRRAKRSWVEAQRLAEVAALQGRTLGECAELLCDDCRRIVHGHYMAHAYDKVTEAIDDGSA